MRRERRTVPKIRRRKQGLVYGTAQRHARPAETFYPDFHWRCTQSAAQIVDDDAKESTCTDPEKNLAERVYRI